MKVEGGTPADPPERAINPKYLIMLGVCLLALVGYVTVDFLGRPDGPDAMASRALSAADAKDRKQAATDLSMVVDRVGALPHLQRVAKETKDPEVMVVILPRLLFFRDRDSLPLCFDALTHSSKGLREKVHYALRAFYGGELPEGIEYVADAPPEQIARVVAKLTEIHTKPKRVPGAAPASPAPATVAVAAAKKDDPVAAALADAKKEEPPSPAPSPSVAPSPPSSAAPTHAAAPAENPAVNLLALMFRVLAVMVLLAEIAGAISLMIGERPAKDSKTPNKQSPSLAEELEVVLARNSAGLWNKIAILVAGAICAVALLMAAELSQLAVRLEQKIDSLPPGR